MISFDDDLVRFARSGDAGFEHPVARWGNLWWDLSEKVVDFCPETVSVEFLAHLVERVRGNSVPRLLDEPTRLGPPLSRANSIICIGQNYAAHARESGSEPPESPIIFFKHPSSLSGPFDSVPIPPEADKVDWEVELAIVIGRDLFRASGQEEAAAAIAGFTISNDVSERKYQISLSGGQWSKGKSFPHFNPLGPFLVPAGELAKNPEWPLTSFVNGEARQASSTADMIFSVTDIIQDLSHVMRLQAGDVINTGTPEGVAFSGKFPYLKSGDLVRLEITGLGCQEQMFV